MKVLLDHNIPIQLKPRLSGHAVFKARELHWDTLKNGDLLRKAEVSGFDALITGDQNLAYQQNNMVRTISLIVLSRTRRRLLVGREDLVPAGLVWATPASYELIAIPDNPHDGAH